MFAREHNQFVDAFRGSARDTPGRGFAVCAIPARPERVDPLPGRDADELFEIARLVVAAEIAKIHTIEWTPQLLYDEPLLQWHERELVRPAVRTTRVKVVARGHRRQ